MATQKKMDTVTQVTERLGKTKTFFLTEYQGLQHKQLEDLRKKLKKVNAEFFVAKNTLVRKAIKDTGAANESDYETLDKALNHQTGTMFAYGDGISAVKVLADYVKANTLPKIKAGLFDGKLATETDFTKLATLPTKEVLIATVLMRMKSPLYGLHRALQWNIQGLVLALNAVKAKKTA